MERYRKLFLEESLKHLRAVEGPLLDGGVLEPASLDHLFREIHSLKGMAASMGHQALADLAHRFEDRLDGWRSAGGVPDEAARSLCLRVCDRLTEMRSDIQEGGDGALDWGDLETELMAGRAGPASSAGADSLQVRIRIAPDCGSPAARAYLILLRFKELDPGLTCAPAETELLAGEPVGQLELWLPSLTRADVEEVYRTLTEVEGLEFPGGEAFQPLERTAAPGPVGPPEPEESAPENRVRLPDTVQAPVRLLDEFVDLLGELTIARSHLEDVARTLGSEILKDEVEGIGKLVREFHTRVMALRMLPFSLITGSLKRLVREHSQVLGKEVDLRISGEEIGLDKSILMQVSDPLMHILRNALDHGVDGPEERERRGRPRLGHITIQVARARNRVEVTVRDDGRGIDTEGVRRKAVELGIYKEEESRGLGSAEILACLFRPGFTTSSSVSELSGRGVGLDVVKSKVDALGGSIEVTSALGEGTEFRLSLPLSVAIIPVLMVDVGGSVLALPTSIVMKTVEAYPRDVRKHHGQHVLLTEKGQVPIVQLAKVLHLGGRQKFERLPLVLIHHRGGLAALAVDRYISEEDLFIKPLKGPLKAFRGVSGYSVLGDGRLVFLLDPPTLFSV